MKRKAISVLLCAALLLSVCIPGMLAFQASGEETIPEGQEAATGESAAVETAAPTAETEADPTDPEADPTDPETVPTEEPPICPECGQAGEHAADCPQFVPEETEDPFDPQEARRVLLASATLEEANALFSTLTEEQAHALFATLTEEDFHELAARLGLLEDRGSVTPPINYTRVGPLMPPVNVSPRLMMGPRAEENGLILSKTAERVPGTDTYKITMEAYTTGEVISFQRSVPTDIVLVLDESGSMRDRIKDYRAVYDLDQEKSYYVKRGNVYTRVRWCDSPPWLLVDPHAPGWYTGTPYVHTSWHDRYDPMTSQEDTTPGHVQFYELVYRQEFKYQVLMDAALRFADQVKADAEANQVDHRISVIGFSNASNVKIGLEMDIRNNVDAVKAAIRTLGADGGTYIEQGLSSAIRVFDSAAPASATLRNRVVIVFTDGIPGNGSWNDTTISGSANPAIDHAHTLKNQYGATVYSIGMLEGADPTLPISGDTSDSARTNKFLHYLSSNYPNATSMSSGGSGSNAGYYLSASDTDSLNEIFTKISQGIATPTISLGSETQIRDIVSPCFTMPADTWEIRLFTAEYNGSSFGERSPLPGANVVLDQDARTVTVSGFDFDTNFVSDEQKPDGTYGRKLIVEFTVTPEEGFLGGNGVPTNGESSGVYDRDGNAVENFPIPEVDVDLKAGFSCQDQSIYLGNTADLEKLLVETITPDGVNNAYVDITYTLRDTTDGERVLAVKVIPAGETGGTWEWVDGAQSNPALEDDNKYSLSCEAAPVNPGSLSEEILENLAPKVSVYKPELTYGDSWAYYGGAVPGDFSGNLNAAVWKHDGDPADTDAMGPAPALTIAYTPDETKIAEGKIAAKQDIPVQAVVHIGEKDVTAHTAFVHVPCSPACGWEDPAEKGDPAFLIHIAACQLTVKKVGGGEGEAYIMDVYKDGVMYTQVTVGADSSETVRELPVGTYFIRENESWAWRYSSTVSGPVTLGAGSHAGTITCSNIKDNDQWLSHSAAARNTYGTVNP